MPRYDLVCPDESCAEKETVLIKHSELAEQVCPKCGKKMKIDYSDMSLSFKNVN